MNPVVFSINLNNEIILQKWNQQRVVVLELGLNIGTLSDPDDDVASIQ